ncbi:hypothetical protein ILYODFUR_027535 [Ilyodon furcidens]|uniref:Tropoelastin n=1 Tax=Ilyodon furcidens TaxID=33524 RepID=A0ABV0TRB3_9TELE
MLWRGFSLAQKGVTGGAGTGLGPGGAGVVPGGGQYSAAAKAAKYGIPTGVGTGGVPSVGVGPGATPDTSVTGIANGSESVGVPVKPGKDVGVGGTALPGPTPIAALIKAPEVPQPIAGGIIQPSGGAGVSVPSGGVGVKPPKPYVPGKYKLSSATVIYLGYVKTFYFY